MTASVFASRDGQLYIYHRAQLQFRDRVVGGVPNSPTVIETWLRTKTLIDDEEELRQLALRTMRELGAEIPEGLSYEEAVKIADGMASERNTNVFKSDEQGAYIEGRQVKAMLKENVNILWPKGRKGPSNKGAKNYSAERLHVVEDRIHLGKEPTRELQIGHHGSPSGPVSTLTNVEVVERALVTFTIKEMRQYTAAGGWQPSFDEDEWANIWLSAQENGLGASRSSSHGRFDVVAWDEVTTP